MAQAPLVPGQSGKSPVVALRIPAHQFAELNKRAAERSITQSAVMREALDAFFAEEATTA
jgi:hypothetical protein